MSDDDFMYEDDDYDIDDYMDEEEYYNSDFESQEESDDPQIELENQYYRSKDLEDDEGLDAAIAGFSKVLDLEKQKDGKHGEWSFKAMKKVVKLTFKSGNKQKLKECYTTLLSYNSQENGITENDLFKGITNILDYVSSSSTETDLILDLYRQSLAAMKKANNENLWFKTSFKLAQRMFDNRALDKLVNILDELKQSCMLPDGTENPKKGNQLLDIYALEIQMYMEKKDTKKVQDLYELGFETAKKNPGTLNSKLAIFHFVGGKLHMEEHQWEKAYSAFFEAFNFFEEAGSRFKIPCLKYILLANMLMCSTIDPFSSPETKNLQRHKEIQPMADLLSSYQHNEIDRFEKILKKHRDTIMGDPFISQFMTDVLREIRTQVLLQLIRPYTRVTLPFMSEELNITEQEVMELLVFLILDDKVVGRVDQVKKELHLQARGDIAKYRYINKWSSQLSSLHATILNRIA
eukprot:CAMPEP_0174261040 /NCGR_PEP_ID=MMETSP0439-20130205/11197_1 /TAXON_ID=0 /ORGANISM="Stereomyxa ramosa, Strain Chinc5" /LENGTH=462 /DNA_ID=CAMNT_0015345451 /DNA_START=17 /DNA_END=1405 /DNA_ORIENTATION=+